LRLIKIKSIYLIAASISLIFVAKATACSQCQFAYFDYFMPPIQIWCLIALGWYLATAILSTVYKVKLWAIPNIALVVLLIVICLVASFIMLGPLSLLPFMIPPLANFIGVLKQKNKYSQKISKTIINIGIFALILLFIFTIQSIKIVMTRTDVKYIVKWDGTIPAIVAFNKILKKNPERLDVYRYIIENEKSMHYAAKGSLKRIAILGDPQEDIPRLNRVMDRANKYDKPLIQGTIDALKAKGKITN